jgi:hypothetical protein
MNTIHKSIVINSINLSYNISSQAKKTGPAQHQIHNHYSLTGALKIGHRSVTTDRETARVLLPAVVTTPGHRPVQLAA